ATVGMLLKELGIPPEYIHAVLVNGRHAELEDRLVSGDRISLFPPVGGG
ncbi:MAG: ThiamineS protein, partial [Thermacetogenium phaeum]